MFEVSTEVTFAAAHRLREYDGPCENIHGHNWRVRATVRSATLNDIGIAIDFKKLREKLSACVCDLDHTDLNVIFDGKSINPSSENIAKFIFERLKTQLAGFGCAVWCVEVYETATSCASYFEHD
jgi:6-pyruvoyltetrahydropterin/6-carboxytetrahydropterin synthase